MPAKPTIKVGDIFETHSGECVVIKYINAKKIYARFTKTGYTSCTRSDCLREGKVKDLLMPRHFGKGFIGEGPYNIREHGGGVWSKMLRRCYDKTVREYQRYGGRGTTVAPIWFNFQVFAEWYVKHHIDGYQLDKDLKIPGSNMYSPDACVFLPQEVNKLLTTCNAKRGLCPVGVHYRKRDQIYSSQCNVKGKNKSLGYYSNPEQAFAAYKVAKEAHVKKVAEEYYSTGQIPVEVYNTLMTWTAIPYPE